MSSTTIQHNESNVEGGVKSTTPRIFYDQSTFDRDGRYRCIAYRYNEKDDIVEYGASVFKKDDETTFKKKAVRRGLSHTARERFSKRPVRIVMKEVKDDIDFQKRLTKAMFRYGAGSKRVSDGVDKNIIHGTI